MAKNGQKWFACCKTRNLNLFLNSTFKSLNLPRPISKVEKFQRKISPKIPLKIIFWLKSFTKIRIDFFSCPPKIVATYTLCFLQIWFPCCIILNSRLSVGSRIISCLLFCFLGIVGVDKLCKLELLLQIQFFFCFLFFLLLKKLVG